MSNGRTGIKPSATDELNSESRYISFHENSSCSSLGQDANTGSSTQQELVDFISCSSKSLMQNAGGNGLDQQSNDTEHSSAESSLAQDVRTNSPIEEIKEHNSTNDTSAVYPVETIYSRVEAVSRRLHSSNWTEWGSVGEQRRDDGERYYYTQSLHLELDSWRKINFKVKAALRETRSVRDSLRFDQLEFKQMREKADDMCHEVSALQRRMASLNQNWKLLSDGQKKEGGLGERMQCKDMREPRKLVRRLKNKNSR